MTLSFLYIDKMDGNLNHSILHENMRIFSI